MLKDGKELLSVCAGNKHEYTSPFPSAGRTAETFPTVNGAASFAGVIVQVKLLEFSIRLIFEFTAERLLANTFNMLINSSFPGSPTLKFPRLPTKASPIAANWSIDALFGMWGKFGGIGSVLTPLALKFGIKVGRALGVTVREVLGDKYGKKKVVLNL
jgi:hypothetical protein